MIAQANAEENNIDNRVQFESDNTFNDDIMHLLHTIDILADSERKELQESPPEYESTSDIWRSLEHNDENIAISIININLQDENLSR